MRSWRRWSRDNLILRGRGERCPPASTTSARTAASPPTSRSLPPSSPLSLYLSPSHSRTHKHTPAASQARSCPSRPASPAPSPRCPHLPVSIPAPATTAAEGAASIAASAPAPRPAVGVAGGVSSACRRLSISPSRSLLYPFSLSLSSGALLYHFGRTLQQRRTVSPSWALPCRNACPPAAAGKDSSSWPTTQCTAGRSPGRPAAVSAHNKTLQSRNSIDVKCSLRSMGGSIKLCVCVFVYFPGPVFTVKIFGHHQRNYDSSIALVIHWWNLLHPRLNKTDSGIGESRYIID